MYQRTWPAEARAVALSCYGTVKTPTKTSEFDVLFQKMNISEEPQVVCTSEPPQVCKSPRQQTMVTYKERVFDYQDTRYKFEFSHFGVGDFQTFNIFKKNQQEGWTPLTNLGEGDKDKDAIEDFFYVTAEFSDGKLKIPTYALILSIGKLNGHLYYEDETVEDVDARGYSATNETGNSILDSIFGVHEGVKMPKFSDKTLF
jgi:hypothetical protein